MTLPWKTWTRSLLPSTTRTCTLTSSPGAKSGMSSRSVLVVDEVGGFHGGAIVSWIERAAGAPATADGQGYGTAGNSSNSAPLVVRQARRGPRSGRDGRAACGAAPGPRRQRSMRPWSPLRSTSGTSQPRNVAGRVYCGSSSSPSAAEALGHRARRRCPSRPGTQAGDGLDHQAGGHLAAGQHDVADAELAVDEVLADPVVDALVAPAQQAEPVAAGQLVGERLVEAAPARARAGTAAAAGRRPRRRRRSARASSPCRRRRRTGRRRRCGARRWCGRAGRGMRRSSSPAVRALPSRLSEQNASTTSGKIVKTSMRSRRYVDQRRTAPSGGSMTIRRRRRARRRTPPARARRSPARAGRRPGWRSPRRTCPRAVPSTSTTVDADQLVDPQLVAGRRAARRRPARW